jgi:hypothetical protein
VDLHTIVVMCDGVVDIIVTLDGTRMKYNIISSSWLVDLFVDKKIKVGMMMLD